MTKQVVHTVDVDLPVRTVYNQWTQFEDFPLFMKHVTSVEQRDARHLHWEAKIAGVQRSWEAEITEQLPDQRIAWRATEGVKNDGVVTFHRLGDSSTRVTLQLDLDPEGFVETVGAEGGFVDDRAVKDLAQFKEFIEARGRETGGYRGRIEHGSDEPDQPATVEFGQGETIDPDQRHDAADRDDVDLRDGASSPAGRGDADDGERQVQLLDERGEPIDHGRRA
jgi:uncharacterized protein YndB with AHSA1/START domain